MSAQVIAVPDLTAQQWFSFAEQHGWSDGLPTLVPTVEAVEEFVEVTTGLPASMGPIVPSGVNADIRSLAANALMAGCSPSAFPVVLAALKAMLADEFNPLGVLATTHPCAPLILLSGRARDIAEVNSGSNCLGQGRRGNATIGRALQLILANLGGSRPGELDKATHGSPAKYTFCFGEDEQGSPWEPLSVRRGFAPGEPVVTVFAAEGPHNINDHGSTCGEQLLTTIAGTMATPGSNNFYLNGEHLLIFGPEHAETLARDGWDIDGVRQALHGLARISADFVSAGKRTELAARGIEPDSGWYKMAGGAECIQIAVAGGPGKHSVWIPTFGTSRCVSIVV